MTLEVSLEGRVALVTGGSRGIGQATALELAASGAAGVTITSRRQESVDQARAELIEAGADGDRI